MAKKKIINQLAEGEGLLVDTNVWQYLFGIEASQDDRGYGSLFEELISRNVKLYINSQIISEFINLNVRITFRRYKENNDAPNIDFKKNYQKTPDFEESYKFAINTIKEDIMPHVLLTKPNNERVTQPLQSYTLKDFNDEIILHDALINNLSILTHDYDYSKYAGQINIYRVNW